MADPTLLARRRSPLHRLTDELRAGDGAGGTLREVPFLAQIGLRAVPGSAAATALTQALGGPLPDRVGAVTRLADDRCVLWLGPDEFLLVAPDEADEATPGPDPARLTAELADAVGEASGQVVDLSANRTTLELSGPSAQQVLDKSCRLDLDPGSFGVDTAVVTQLGTTGVILWRTGDQTWRVMPRSSFAVHVARWLLDGMREYR